LIPCGNGCGVAVVAARLGWAQWVARPSSLDVGAGPPPAGAPAANCKVLTAEQLEFFDRCGYLVLSQVVPKAEADIFVSA